MGRAGRFGSFYRGPETQGSSESARVRGARAKKLGTEWETLLAQAAENYRLQGRANIRRVGAPFRPTRKPTKTRYGFEFHGVFEGEGPCDLVGHIGSQPFEADAKRTGLSTRWPFDMLKPHQAKSLDLVAAFSGHAGLLVQVDGRGFWLPWALIRERWWAWHDVQEAGGKAKRGQGSISLEDCERLGVEFYGGDFLPAVLKGADDV